LLPRQFPAKPAHPLASLGKAHNYHSGQYWVEEKNEKLLPTPQTTDYH
jgi:hypothetical protein